MGGARGVQFGGFEQVGGHLPDQDCWVGFCGFGDRVREPVGLDQGAIFVGGVADAADYAEEV